MYTCELTGNPESVLEKEADREEGGMYLLTPVSCVTHGVAQPLWTGLFVNRSDLILLQKPRI
jgi:hypothetical protein